MKTGLLTELLDLVAPRLCVVCGRRLSASESHVCGACHMHIEPTGFALCPTDNPMARRFWGLFPVERAAAWFFYEAQSEVSRMIYALKYGHQPDIGRWMGMQMARDMAPHGFFDGIDALVPVPLSRSRQRQRGYNQSEQMALGIGHATGLPVLSGALRRNSFDQSQTHKALWQRLDSVRDAFSLADASAVAGKHLLLTDDIVTTGATMTACATLLCQAEGVTVSVVSAGVTR